VFFRCPLLDEREREQQQEKARTRKKVSAVCVSAAGDILNIFSLFEGTNLNEKEEEVINNPSTRSGRKIREEI
jgi:hypothetical protein